MVRRQQYQIDQAIESAVKDVPAAHVANWCKHIRLKQVTTSMLGEMVGLPIGPKSVSCAKVGGEVMAQTYSVLSELSVGAG